MGAVAVGARSHRLIGWPRPSSNDRTVCPSGRRVAARAPATTDSDVRSSSCTVRGHRSADRCHVRRRSGSPGRPACAAGSAGSRRSAAPSVACAPGRPRSGSRTGGTADASDRARARASGRRSRNAAAADGPRRAAGTGRTWSAGVHGHSRSANRDSAAKIVPMPGDDRLVEQHLGDRRRPAGRPAPQRPRRRRPVSPSMSGPEVADERALVAGAHHVEHAEVVPDRRPLGGGQHGADVRRAARRRRRPRPRDPPVARPCAGACAACGRRRTGSAGACRRTGLQHRPADQVDRGGRRPAQVGPDEHLSGERQLEAGRRCAAGRRPQARGPPSRLVPQAQAAGGGREARRDERLPERRRAAHRRGPRRRRHARW